MFGHKVNVRFGDQTERHCVFSANSLYPKELTKIGNKVSIPLGVKKLFPKIEPLAKHIALAVETKNRLI